MNLNYITIKVHLTHFKDFQTLNFLNKQIIKLKLGVMIGIHF